MKKKILFLLLVALLSFSPALRAQEKRIATLKDGTKLVGEIASFENGVYTILTAFGPLHVQDKDVVSITASAVQMPLASQENFPPLNPSIDAQVSAIQGELLKDEQFIAKVQELSKNPEIIQLMSQPGVMQAVTSHDFNALQSNPAIQEFIKNPQVLELLQSIKQKLPADQSSP